MSATVDGRVVEMRFDNKHFERNVQTSLSTIDRLKQSLKLEGAGKGFEELDKAAKSVSLDGIASGVESLQKRFSAFGIMGMRALENVTDSMMALANRTLGFLTNGIVQGGINRAMNLENAHFQLQGLLKDEEAVQAVMKNVGDSVDGTAYSLDSAAKVASQFAASGMRAGDQMFSSLRAVAGVAAMTNSEYDDIGRIFTTVAGNGRLMGDQLLQLSSKGMNAAATLAEYLTKVGEGAKVTEADVREMVSDGKVSFETFAAAMDDAFGEHAKKANETFTGAISNVKSALARIGAEFVSPLVEQNGALVKFFNILRERVNDVKANIGPLAEGFVGIVTRLAGAASEYLGKLDLTGHFKVFYNVLEGVGNILKGMWEVIKPIGQAFVEIFPPKTAEEINLIAESFRALTEKFKIGEETSRNLKDTFRGVFAILDMGARAFMAIAGGISELVGFFLPAVSGMLGLTGGLGKWLAKLDETTEKTSIFQVTIGKAVSVIKAVASVGSKALEVLKEFGLYLKAKFNFPSFEEFHNLMNRIFERLLYMKDSILSVLKAMGDGLSQCGFLNMLQTLWDGVRTVAGGIAETLGELVNRFVDGLASADFNAVLDVINSLSLSAIAFGMSEFLETLSKPMRPFSGIIANVKYGLQELRTTLKGYQAQLKADVLMKIAGAIALLAGSILILSLIDGDKLQSSVMAITVMFTDLMAAMGIMSKVSGSVFGAAKSVTAMVALSLSVLIMASAVKKLSGLDMDSIAVGMAGVIGLTTVMVAAAKIMGSGGKTVIKGAGSLVVFAIAIRVLVGACEGLSGLSWEELCKGLVGVGILLAELCLFLKMAKFSGKAMSTATGIVILSVALKILASVCNDFGTMDWEEIEKGLASIGTLLAGFMLFTRLTGNAKRMVSIGTSLVLVGASMKIFADVMREFGRMAWEGIGKGLAAMGGALAEVTVAARMMPSNIAGIGIGLVIVGAALESIADVMGKLGGLSWEEIGKGLLVMGVSLAELAIGLNLMRGTLKGAAAIAIAAVSLAILAPVLKGLGKMSWGSVAKGLIVLAGAFAVIGVAGMALAPLIPVLLGLSGAFVLLGLAILGIGAGFLAAGAGLAAFVAAGASGAAIFVSALTVIITGVASLIPVVVAKIGEGFIALCKTIADGAPAIAEAVKAIILCVVSVLVECVPVLSDGVLALVAGILGALAEHTPQIVDSLFQFLIGLLEGLARNLPDLIQAGVNVLEALFTGVLDAFRGVDMGSFLDGMLGMGVLSGIIVALSAVAGMIPAAMVGVLGMGAVLAELALVFAAMGALGQIPGLSWAIGEGGKLLERIGHAIGSFVGGIVGGIIGGVTSQFPKIGDDLSAFMENIQPFIAGASKIDPSMMDGVNALAGALLVLTAADILNGLASWLTGGSSLVKFAQEIVPFGKAIAEYSETVSDRVDHDAVTTSANAGKVLAELSRNLPNSGGALGLLMGENNIDDFGRRINVFGEAIA
ncbi:tape measure protein, partial [Lachnospiraceae bacterium 29-84]